MGLDLIPQGPCPQLTWLQVRSLVLQGTSGAEWQAREASKTSCLLLPASGITAIGCLGLPRAS